MTNKQAFRAIFELMDKMAEAESDDEEMQLREQVRDICSEHERIVWEDA